MLKHLTLSHIPGSKWKQHQTKRVGVIIDNIWHNVYVPCKYQKEILSTLFRQGNRADIYTNITYGGSRLKCTIL